MSIDSLDLVGDASAILERHGFIACGRRVDGRTRVDFWTRHGVAYRYELRGNEQSVDEVVTACLALVPPSPLARTPRRSSNLS
jgi:hypothetical protein